jgi:hypothetical protein
MMKKKSTMEATLNSRALGFIDQTLESWVCVDDEMEIYQDAIHHACTGSHIAAAWEEIDDS